MSIVRATMHPPRGGKPIAWFAVVLSVLCGIGMPIGSHAGELEELQKEFGALDPQKAGQLLAQCHDEEIRALREATETRESTRTRLAQINQKLDEYAKQIDEQKKLLDRRRRENSDELSACYKRVRAGDAIYEDCFRMDSQNVIREAEVQGNIDLLQELQMKPLVDEKNGLQATQERPGWVAARCKLLETLVRSGPTEADKLAQQAADAIARGKLDEATERHRELASRAGQDDPRVQKLAESLAAAYKQDAEVNANIAEARREYNEARNLELDGLPAQAVDAFRVARQLLADAREKTRSQERAEKIDKAIERISRRMADFPGMTEEGQNDAGRQAGNLHCASQFENAVMVKMSQDGNYWCGCKAGYAFNDDRNACKAQSKEDISRAACRKKYANSVPVGISDGKVKCACPRGRTWNEAGTACISGTPEQAQRGMDPRTAEALYALGAAIGQVIRSNRASQSNCHFRPGTNILHCGGQ